MFFDQIPQGAPDPVFGLLNRFAADHRPTKINLLVGIYQDEHLHFELLPSVKKAKGEIFSKDLLSNYLPIDGSFEFLSFLGPLAFSPSLWKEREGVIYGAQTPGGTGALRLGAELLVQQVGKRLLIPNETWPNHRTVFEKGGFQVETYPYYNRKKRGFDFEKMAEALSKAPPKTAVLLHACCQNPTGCDPTLEEWRRLSSLFQKRELIPFFDFAYQGLGDGLEEDRKGVAQFLGDGHEMLIAYSCSKNFSMYCQRVGALYVATTSAEAKGRVGSQVKRLIRSLYSNPPAHGAKIVAHILGSPELSGSWEKEVEKMRFRLSDTRNALIAALEKRGGGNFDYLKGHKGMFSFFDLTPPQVTRLIDQFGIYLLESGRANIAGLNRGNLEFFVESMIAVLDG